ncbi:MAG: hypothetical protein HY372_01290 [Candidatus Andersenbacteria bacterium]|nr:hypothetical protein [Candidatus Andersenbacteria bacterium]
MLFRKQADGEPLPWDEAAQSALNQALQQAPIPALLHSTVKKELARAAETHARKHARTSVTVEDLMQGLLTKMPVHIRAKVEQAIKQGPAGLHNLKREQDTNA